MVHWSGRGAMDAVHRLSSKQQAAAEAFGAGPLGRASTDPQHSTNHGLPPPHWATQKAQQFYWAADERFQIRSQASDR